MEVYQNYKAGFICDAIAKVVNEYKSTLDSSKKSGKKAKEKVEGLLESVSAFDIKFNKDLEYIDNTKLNSILSVLNNIISRGLPTRAPILLENLFVEVGLTKSNKEKYSYNFKEATFKLDYETIFELLHIVEPGLKISRKEYVGALESKGEWRFLNSTLKKYPFAKQILEAQRQFASINKKFGAGRRVDFSYEFPYHSTKNLNKEGRGVIFEFDGTQHELKTYKCYDEYRDIQAAQAGFSTSRQSSTEFDISEGIKNDFRKNVFKIFEKNYARTPSESMNLYSLIFIPLAVARIQRTLIEYLLRSPDSMKQSELRIAVVERDFPCSGIAVKALQEALNQLNFLLKDGAKQKIPKLDLTIFENKEWVYSDILHCGFDVKSDEVLFNENNYDIIIDHSILRRSNIFLEKDYQSEKAIKVRSSHYVDTTFGFSRRIYCADLLNYKGLVKRNDDGSYAPLKETEKAINYFIQNIFRKKSFREGQLPIISRALQQKAVVGLLPTGGGKSLTFQLSCFLQPGLCLVVDPIKSLMEDQVRVLRENWIDCCDYINSNLERETKAKKLVNFQYGESLFFFISPERFVMDEFRQIIQNIDTNGLGLAFSYCVIDEVHCVSEWGHDFRSTYLMLGKNAQQFAKTRRQKKEAESSITLVGLTATASFDVLSDIERELQIKDDDIANAVIMIENTIRPELFFRVVDVTGKVRIDELNDDFSKMGKKLARINTKKILEESQKHHFDEFEKWNFASAETRNSQDQSKIKFEYKDHLMLENFNLVEKDQNDFYSIVFCQVKGVQKEGQTTVNEMGVEYVFNHLESQSKGFFYGVDAGGPSTARVLKSFERFTADKLKHIVCTKAFGMGIDKSDIRTTYHFAYSSSLESLVQEAGRAGRDKKVAESVILLSTERYYRIDVFKLFRENNQSQILKQANVRKVLRNLFDKKWDQQNKKYIKITFKTESDLINSVKTSSYNLVSKVGNIYFELSKQDRQNIENLLLSKDFNRNYKYIYEKYKDREIHDFFYSLSFKGLDTEKSQYLNLFKVKEFYYAQQGGKDIKQNIPQQLTLLEEFEKSSKRIFSFILANKKVYPEATKKICVILNVKPNDPPKYYQKPSISNFEIIRNVYQYAEDFNDFLFLLEERSIVKLSSISDQDKEKLRFVYSRDRYEVDTGKLIYRMYSMGFLEDYKIDYQKGQYHCAFVKENSINYYINAVDAYLRKYLSEKEVARKIVELKNRCGRADLIEDILECLYFLAEFSYTEIASKRLRATDEIEKILNDSVLEPTYRNNWFEQNKYIKEQIYFYFNAKYARIGFKIGGKPYSLLDDYKDESIDKRVILDKYLDVFDLDGTEQNNYKHMIGACKKILRTLAEGDLKKEWVLRLLKSFAMYSVNNPSYISEANGDLKQGFELLYAAMNNNIEKIQPIFNSYFELLQKNINEDNTSFKDIKLIRLNLLLKLQTLSTEDLLIQFNTILK